MLPRVKIIFENGALGSVIPSPDGVLMFLATGVTVANKFVLGTAYMVTKFSDLEDNLGITEVNNPAIHKLFSDFYSIAPEGTEAWVVGHADTASMTDMIDPLGTIKPLLLSRNGRIRGLIVSRKPSLSYVPTMENALDSDVWTAITNAQIIGTWAAETLFAPLFVIIEGRSFEPADIGDLPALNTMTNNRVGVFMGSASSSSSNLRSEDIGLVAGRIASIPVHRNIGRVKDGALPITHAYIHSSPIEGLDTGYLHDYGYITFRNYVGRTGFYFTDDPLATLISDDYHSITARRTIDKAYRIAYDTLLNELLDEIPVNADGTMQSPMAKMWEGKVINAIALQMTANGELSADVTDPKDRGVECFIDPTQNVISTSKVNVRVRVKPFGYSRYIDIYLGFKAVTT